MTEEAPMSTTRRSANVTAMVIETLRSQPVLRVRSAWTIEDCAGGAPGRDIAEVHAALVRQGLRQAGPPYCSYRDFDERGLMHAESGIPVDRAGLTDGRVEPGVLPGGDVASVLYTGPYAGVGDAHRQLRSEMEAAGLTAVGEPRDVYVTSPDATPDPEDYVTEVVWPIGS
jgi:AraC family transcriptional regulator